MYYNPERWPTSDGYIPFKLFVVMADMIDHLSAMEQLRHTRATQLGQLLAENGKDTAVQSHSRALERLAMPKDDTPLEAEGDEQWPMSRGP